MAFCSNCGTEVKEGGRFCTACGTPVVQAQPVAETTASVAPVQPVAEPIEPEVTIRPTIENVTPTADSSAQENPYGTQATAPAEEPIAPTEPAASVKPVNTYTPPVASATPVYTPNPQAPTTTQAEQNECLASIYNNLKRERLCWKIFGIVFMVLAGLFTILAFASPALIAYALLVYLPIGIIDLIMIKKVNYYINTLYTDCGPVVERCSSVGMIVFGAFFNTIAMIFIIINFAGVKSKKATLDDIKRNQDANNNRTNNF